MIKIEIRKNKSGAYTGFSCKGHAGYASSGNDIVCAAISMLVINTINSLEELAHEDLSVTEDEAFGIIECTIRNEISESGQLLMDAMLLGCNGVINDYGKKFVKVNCKEV